MARSHVEDSLSRPAAQLSWQTQVPAAPPQKKPLRRLRTQNRASPVAPALSHCAVAKNTSHYFPEFERGWNNGKNSNNNCTERPPRRSPQPCSERPPHRSPPPLYRTASVPFRCRTSRRNAAEGVGVPRKASACRGRRRNAAEAPECRGGHSLQEKLRCTRYTAPYTCRHARRRAAKWWSSEARILSRTAETSSAVRLPCGLRKIRCRARLLWPAGTWAPW
jgi:hypothetical protein